VVTVDIVPERVEGVPNYDSYTFLKIDGATGYRDVTCVKDWTETRLVWVGTAANVTHSGSHTRGYAVVKPVVLYFKL
jgi:hypothetical protein